MTRLQNFPAQLSSTRAARPRMLRAIPSVVILTTAMAWGAASYAGVLGLGGALAGQGGLIVAAGPSVGVGVGAGAGGGVSVGTVGVGAGGGANTDVTVGGGTANIGLGLDTAARAGANGNITAEDRAAATTEVGVRAGGAVNASGSTSRAGAVLDDVKGAARATGSTVRKTGQGVIRGVTSGAQGAGSVDAAAGAGVNASGGIAGGAVNR